MGSAGLSATLRRHLAADDGALRLSRSAAATRKNTREGSLADI
jgi:hypothetical protein